MESKNVIKSIIILALFFLNTSGWCQKKETIYLLFEKSKDNEKKISEERDRIYFFIGRESFLCTDKKESIDTLDVSHLNRMKVLKIDELKLKETNVMKEKGKEIMKEYGIPFPTKTMYHNMFNIYIIEKIDCNKIVKYKVKWESFV